MEMKIERVLKENSEDKVMERKKVASENTLNQRAALVVQILNIFLKKKKLSD